LNMLGAGAESIMNADQKFETIRGAVMCDNPDLRQLAVAVLDGVASHGAIVFSRDALRILTLLPERGLITIWETDIPVELVRIASQVKDTQRQDITRTIVQVYRLGIHLNRDPFDPELCDKLAEILLHSLNSGDKRLDLALSTIGALMEFGLCPFSTEISLLMRPRSRSSRTSPRKYYYQGCRNAQE